MSACCACCGLAAPSSNAVGLTARQRQVLQYLEQCAARSVSPTYGEIAHAIGTTSKGSAHRLVSSLKERGHLRHNSHSRSILVIGMQPEARV